MVFKLKSCTYHFLMSAPSTYSTTATLIPITNPLTYARAQTAAAGAETRAAPAAGQGAGIDASQFLGELEGATGWGGQSSSEGGEKR